MTTITPTEACARLAEMMGRCTHKDIRRSTIMQKSVCRDCGMESNTYEGLFTFNPLTDANQAIECLEAWVYAGDYDGHRKAVFDTETSIPYSAILTERGGYMGCQKVGYSTNTSLNHAICEALLSAEAGESITIGGE